MKTLVTFPTLLGLVLSIGSVGCTPAGPPQAPQNVFQNAPPDLTLIIVLDLSGSYQQFMDDGKAWHAVLNTIKGYYRNRMGENDRLIIGQISAQTVAPLFDGSPKAFGREFKDAATFRAKLKAQSNPNGSPVHSSTDATLRYGMMRMTPTNSTFLAVFSDFDENFPDAQKTERKLCDTLAEFARKGGAVGLYWLNLDQAPKWHANLAAAGFPFNKMVISSSIDAEPVFPQFD